MIAVDTSLLFIVVVIVVNPVWICSAGSETGMPLTPSQLKDLESAIKIENETLQISLEYLPVVEGVSAGLQHAVKECKHLFRWDRWNCPVHWSLLTRTSVLKATRETAYLQAISAAGIMYHVSKRCKQLNKGICDCGSKLREQPCETQSYYYRDTTWYWTGCQQNFRFGEKVARIFLGVDEGSNTAVSEMKSHNELVGIEMVTKALVLHCKCHGSTGSCALKTCWNVLPDFRKIGTRLKKKYKMSKQTQHEKIRSSKQDSDQSEISKHDLVYSETSPDYCHPDKSTGHPGTIGRDCMRFEKGSNKTMPRLQRISCPRLCKGCGHKVRSELCLETAECDTENEFCDWECKPCEAERNRYFCG